MSYEEFNFSFCYWLIIIGIFLCPIMWLGSPRNMKSLAITSVFTVLTVTILTWYCIISDEFTVPKIAGSPSYLRTGLPPLQNILLAYGIIAFQFDVHPALLTIQVDMEDKTKIGHAVSGAILVTGTLFALTAFLGALRYGGSLKSNILEGLPGSYPLYLVIMLVTLQLCLSNAVGSSPLYQHIEDYLNIPREFNSKRMLVRSCLIILAVIIGEAVPDFDLVMQLIGGTLTGPLMFILPPLFYTKMRYLEKIYDEKYETKNKRDKDINQFTGDIDLSINSNSTFSKKTKSFLNRLRNRSNYFIPAIVAVLGLFATFTATYFSFKNVVELANFTPPCLFNITSFLTNF